MTATAPAIPLMTATEIATTTRITRLLDQHQIPWRMDGAGRVWARDEWTIRGAGESASTWIPTVNRCLEFLGY